LGQVGAKQGASTNGRERVNVGHDSPGSKEDPACKTYGRTYKDGREVPNGFTCKRHEEFGGWIGVMDADVGIDSTSGGTAFGVLASSGHGR